MRRVVLPEKLDSLPEDDPGAVANRRDLRKINFLMGNYRWLRKVLNRRLIRSDSVSEWAAGDGAFGASLARAGKGVVLKGVDLCRRPDEWPSDGRWQQANLLDLQLDDIGDVVIGNFILHQFEDEQLFKLGELLNARARLVVFNETARSQTAIILSRLTESVSYTHLTLPTNREV